MIPINQEVKITKEEAHELLMLHKDNYLWHKQYSRWTQQDYENLLSGKNSSLTIRTQRVEVTLNNGIKKEYSSIKSVANKFIITQSAVSNILAGRKTTNKFLSISRI